MNDKERLTILVETLRHMAAKRVQSKPAKAVKQWAKDMLKQIEVTEHDEEEEDDATGLDRLNPPGLRSK